MIYQIYEMNHAALAPLRAAAEAMRIIQTTPLNPLSYTTTGRTMVAGLELFERMTRRYGKPEFGLTRTMIDGELVEVGEEIVWSKPFCDLVHFKRHLPSDRKPDQKLMLVAPMSGHFATLLRGTVEALLPHADVYITDWTDARIVPVIDGGFGLDDYIDYLMAMIRHIGPDAHIVGVCQPSVPVLAAVALMEATRDPSTPASMVLMGGPIDTRNNPTAVNLLAQQKPLSWFRNVIVDVPWPNPGFMRRVYPGFLQLCGFMSMNLDRHISAHGDYFRNMVKNDGDPLEKHRAFYDEYLAVMDLTEEFYLQTVDAVFIRHLLPKGQMTHRDIAVDTRAVRNVALLTIEGENDDISGLGQTEAAHAICPNIPQAMRMHYMQPDVGHYGVFNGSRFRNEIAPRILEFVTRHARGYR